MTHQQKGTTPFVTICLVILYFGVCRFPAFEIPYALDIHTPPVTSLHYCANCPEEFIASLHSVKSKMVHDTKSTKVMLSS